MDQGLGGIAGIGGIALLLLALAPFIIMFQLGRIWHWTRRNEWLLTRIDKHLAKAVDDAAQ